ncbi:MAG: type III pantothenate kinase [Leptospiraceae bacterium]|nr:type III pantothenate kinase [Leptospiraceae bacterium]
MKYGLAVDIGNTNTVFGLYSHENGGEIQKSWRTVTHRDRTSDELGIFLNGFLHSSGIRVESIEHFIYSSVVPSFNPIVEKMVRDYYNTEPLRVHYEMPLPLEFVYPRPYEIGPDRIVNAVAASRIYGGDLIVIDLGTATTFCLLHGTQYMGGSIAPGLKLSMEALSRRAAMLPPIEFACPPGGVLGDSTMHSIQSGFFFGWVGLLREIIQQFRNREPARKYRVIATGGLASLIHGEQPDLFDQVDGLLTLRGLQIIHEHLQKL